MWRFNPHPARWPDATVSQQQVLYLVIVSILIRLAGRMPRLVSVGYSSGNPLVSILIRLAGRMPLALRLGCCHSIDVFQSSSGSLAGCHGAGRARCPLQNCFNPHPARWPDATGKWRLPRRRRFYCFNPHPARWPDATVEECSSSGAVDLFQSSSGSLAGCHLSVGMHQGFVLRVSILIRLAGRMPHHFERCRPHWGNVSILIRLAGRMPRPSSSTWNWTTAFQSSSGSLAGCHAEARLAEARAHFGFQSSSGSLAGCHRLPSPGSMPRWVCFNPHPARWPDATTRNGLNLGLIEVSILIRLAGRMPRKHHPQTQSRRICFNPHPARWPDATCVRPAISANIFLFQSSSGSLAGCHFGAIGVWQQFRSVVSILIRLAGRMPPGGVAPLGGQQIVSILIRLAGRMPPDIAQHRGDVCVVSILIRLAGRMPQFPH